MFAKTQIICQMCFYLPSWRISSFSKQFKKKTPPARVNTCFANCMILFPKFFHVPITLFWCNTQKCAWKQGNGNPATDKTVLTTPPTCFNHHHGWPKRLQLLKLLKLKMCSFIGKSICLGEACWFFSMKCSEARAANDRVTVRGAGKSRHQLGTGYVRHPHPTALRWWYFRFRLLYLQITLFPTVITSKSFHRPNKKNFFSFHLLTENNFSPIFHEQRQMTWFYFWDLWCTDPKK